VIDLKPSGQEHFGINWAPSGIATEQRLRARHDEYRNLAIRARAL
jgi:hypothetical protein